jgi:endogenous inhibitor of DNA gyrase (YacG/DUF329 family)
MARTGRPRTAKRIKVRCDWCGIEFERPEYQQYGTRFCSRECYWSWKKGKEQPLLRRREAKVCPTCGTTFEVGGAAGHRDQIYCSRECAGVSKYPPPAHLQPVDAAYIAGFFDGEGSIIRTKPGTWRVVIYQSDEATIRWLAEVIGTGLVSIRDTARSNLVNTPTNPKPQWFWQLYGKNAALFMKQIRPYMRVKAARADEMLADY